MCYYDISYAIRVWAALMKMPSVLFDVQIPPYMDDNLNLVSQVFIGSLCLHRNSPRSRCGQSHGFFITVWNWCTCASTSELYLGLVAAVTGRSYRSILHKTQMWKLCRNHLRLSAA